MKTLLLLCFISLQAYATKIQIIHTNDLHSYLKGYSPEQGGYYRVKTLIDKLKSEAQLKGIESIVLDGGDFGEGSHYFLADEGIHSFEALKRLGIDAAVIGNHDYMFGGKKLGEQIRAVNSKTQFLGANIAHTLDMKLTGLLKPTARFNVSGIQVEVIGLTTSSLHFSYAISPGLIFPAAPVSRSHSKKAKEEGADLVVALTHLGLSKDKSLVKKDENLDIVIGGHSHTRLDKILWEKNILGKNVPIVQTGAQGNAVGSLILDVTKGAGYKVVSYKLHDADTSVKPDKDLLEFVNEVDKKTKKALAGDRFDEVIGYSDYDLSGYGNSGHVDHQEGCWTSVLGDIVREGNGADIGLYLSSFAGKLIPAGPITYGNIIENFPHIQAFGQPGWEVMTFRIDGWKLYSLLTAMINLDKGFLTSKYYLPLEPFLLG